MDWSHNGQNGVFLTVEIMKSRQDATSNCYNSISVAVGCDSMLFCMHSDAGLTGFGRLVDDEVNFIASHTTSFTSSSVIRWRRETQISVGVRGGWSVVASADGERQRRRRHVAANYEGSNLTHYPWKTTEEPSVDVAARQRRRDKCGAKGPSQVNSAARGGDDRFEFCSVTNRSTEQDRDVPRG